MFPKPPIVPPPEHPRLFMRKRHVPELVRNMTRPEMKQAWERLEQFSRYGAEEVNAEHCQPTLTLIW